MTEVQEQTNNKNFCLCGCGQQVTNYKYKPRKYISGHNSKGVNHHNWNGGVYTDKEGYILLKKREHPFANPLGYVREHRLIYEHYLKILFDEDIYIPQEIDIHHENGNVQDNSLINLNPKSKVEHIKIHDPRSKRKYLKKDYSNTFCLLCNSKDTYKRDWRKYKNGYICNKCYLKKYRVDNRLKKYGQ